jgi:hypothetical protein
MQKLILFENLCTIDLCRAAYSREWWKVGIMLNVRGMLILLFLFSSNFKFENCHGDECKSSFNISILSELSWNFFIKCVTIFLDGIYWEVIKLFSSLTFLYLFFIEKAIFSQPSLYFILLFYLFYFYFYFFLKNYIDDV